MKIDELINKLIEFKKNGYDGGVDVFSEDQSTLQSINSVEYLYDIWASDTEGLFIRTRILDENIRVCHSMNLRVEDGFCLNKNSEINVGDFITLKYLNNKQKITKIDKVEVKDSNTITIHFLIDLDTYIGFKEGNTLKDFIDADLKCVIIDNKESEDWIWV